MESFTTYIEHDTVRQLYGFAEPQSPLAPEPGGNPIKAFGREQLMAELAGHKVGQTAGHKLLGEVRWGDGAGAVRVRLSPNFLLMVERLTDDLEGRPAWVCKRVARVKVIEFAGEEETVAKDVSEQVDAVASTPIDAARPSFPMGRLLQRTVDKVRKLTGPFVFEHVKSNGPYWKTIQFGLTGNGVGQLVRHTPAQGGTPLALLELAFQPERGLLKTVFTTVGQDARSGQWIIQIPYFEALFSPTQHVEEIADSLLTSIRMV